jgi:regulator of sigma E protease
LSILALTGLPKILDNQYSQPGDTKIVEKPVELTSISNGYPAQKAGLKNGDEVILLAGRSVPTPESFVAITKQYKGQTIAVVYNRGGVEETTQVTLRNSTTGPLFGAELGQSELIKATWSAPLVGVVTTAQLTWATLQGVGDLVGNLVSGLVLQLSPSAATRHQASTQLAAAGNSVAGPVGILGTIFPEAEQAGPTQLVFLTAVISLTLAVMNVLPIPALDGGRWYTMALFRLFRKPLTQKREERIQAVGFYTLMVLIVIITIGDVTKLFK